MQSTHGRLLLVDDDVQALQSLSRALGAAGFDGHIQAAGSAELARELAREMEPHVAIIDLNLNEKEGVESGFALLRWMVDEQALCRPIVLTGHASMQHGIRALDIGAAHFLEKPADIPHLMALISDSLAQSALRREYADLKKAHTWQQFSNALVGTSPEMRQVREAISLAARTSQPVVITGETGSGKGVAAQLIHRLSSRAKGKFVRYQPSFGSSDLVSSELFGHVRGAFTGADQERRGLLAEAHGGTLFLDEIEDLPLETQIALLGVLQDKRFRPVGSNAEYDSDFRLVCACNQDLRQCLETGKLRSDFYHRIAHFRIHMPALRNRRLDIPELTDYVLGRLEEREELSLMEISQGAMSILQSHDWPGNVRELEAVVENGAYRAAHRGRRMIEPDDIELEQRQTQACGTLSYHEQVQNFKQRLIMDALTRHAGNRIQAARELGLDRNNMRRMLKYFGT